MLAEIRYISFPPVEVVSAVAAYRTRCGDPLPRGSVIGFDVGGGPGIRATLRLVETDSGTEKTIVEDGERLAAALVLYCIHRKVPIPAKAHKRLYCGRDGGVVMAYAMGLDILGREAFAATIPPVFVEPPVRSGPAARDPDGVVEIDTRSDPVTTS